MRVLFACAVSACQSNPGQPFGKPISDPISDPISEPSYNQIKAQFADLVYYSGAVDVYFQHGESERKFRVHTDDGVFNSVMEQFSADDESGEGPPGYDEKQLGSWYCIELDIELGNETIAAISEPDQDGNCR